MARRHESVVAARLPDDVAKTLRESAAANDRSISGEIRVVLRRWAEERRASGVYRK